MKIRVSYADWLIGLINGETGIQSGNMEQTWKLKRSKKSNDITVVTKWREKTKRIPKVAFTSAKHANSYWLVVSND